MFVLYKQTVSLYIPTNNIQEFPLFHILVNTWHCPIFSHFHGCVVVRYCSDLYFPGEQMMSNIFSCACGHLNVFSEISLAIFYGYLSYYQIITALYTS